MSRLDKVIEVAKKGECKYGIPTIGITYPYLGDYDSVVEAGIDGRKQKGVRFSLAHLLVGGCTCLG